MTELKPCPFCGGKAQYRKENNGFGVGYHYVGCGCIEGCSARGRTKEQAIEAWNNRPSPWHTGTPSEEGWYVIKTKYGSLFLVQKNSHGFWIEDKFGYEALVPTEGYILEYQKIEPYKEKKK